jgi:hypothetical protein
VAAAANVLTLGRCHALLNSAVGLRVGSNRGPRRSPQGQSGSAAPDISSGPGCSVSPERPRHAPRNAVMSRAFERRPPASASVSRSQLDTGLPAACPGAWSASTCPSRPAPRFGVMIGLARFVGRRALAWTVIQLLNGIVSVRLGLIGEQAGATSTGHDRRHHSIALHPPP